MPLVPASVLVQHAHRNKYAVVQVNTNGGTYDITRAIVEVAEELRPGDPRRVRKNLKYRGYEYAAHADAIFRRARRPCRSRFTRSWINRRRVPNKRSTPDSLSVMIDGSHLPIDQNIELAKQVVAISRPKNITVEAEVGELQKLNPDGSMSEVKNLSDPQEVSRMSRETGIDMLAVGIGTRTGFTRMRRTSRSICSRTRRRISKVPLVLHGSTGLADDVIARCVSMGMAKANLGTLIRTRCVEYTAEVIAEKQAWRSSVARRAGGEGSSSSRDIAHMLAVTGRPAGRRSFRCEPDARKHPGHAGRRTYAGHEHQLVWRDRRGEKTLAYVANLRCADSA